MVFMAFKKGLYKQVKQLIKIALKQFSFLPKRQQRALTGRNLINSLFIGPPTGSTWIISGRAGPGLNYGGPLTSLHLT